MSTGLDCYFEEKEPNKWFLYLEREPRSELDLSYERFGPFETFVMANKYLIANFASPGGYRVHAHPKSTDKSWKYN